MCFKTHPPSSVKVLDALLLIISCNERIGYSPLSVKKNKQTKRNRRPYQRGDSGRNYARQIFFRQRQSRKAKMLQALDSLTPSPVCVSGCANHIHLAADHLAMFSDSTHWWFRCAVSLLMWARNRWGSRQDCRQPEVRVNPAQRGTEWSECGRSDRHEFPLERKKQKWESRRRAASMLSETVQWSPQSRHFRASSPRRQVSTYSLRPSQ